MNIHLTDKDISQMPESGSTWFLNWLLEHLKPKSLDFEQFNEIQEDIANFHVKLTQLLA